MSKISKAVRTNSSTHTVVNFMGGTSYVLNPLQTLKLIACSSIFSEPQYYRPNHNKTDYSKVDKNESYVSAYRLFDFDKTTPSDIMTKAIDASLDYDFGRTISFADSCRNDSYMRLNPQIIMVRAALNPHRVLFNQQNPGIFSSIQKRVLKRADEPATQLAYYLYVQGSKQDIPSILKRTWKERLESASRYELSKYKNSELGIINTVRICHATNPELNELMKTGTLEVTDSQKTWEQLRSDGMTWKEILSNHQIHIPHMALLRNLRNIFSEMNEEEDALAKHVFDSLKKGVHSGKQFPFRYYSAYQSIDIIHIAFKKDVLAAIEDCLILSRENMPTLKGKTMVLTDNSGSAWGSFTSEYGETEVATINNLSAILTAQNSEEGYVGVFGDQLKILKIEKDISPFIYMNKISEMRSTIGQSTECGIWLFFKEALHEKQRYDNIFIYSDMQAGYGGLYVTDNELSPLKKSGAAIGSRYVNVLSLLDSYRREVNTKSNMFSIQTAGYNNNILPDYCYRSAILSGWTGKELAFASKVIDEWNEIESMQ